MAKKTPAGTERTYRWPRPAVTVDVAVFTVEGALNELRLKALLVQRAQEPFRDAWALPGGFVHEDEDLLAAAERELLEETGVRGAFLEQVGAEGAPGRDPRGHTVTVVYVALVPHGKYQLSATGDAARAEWFEVNRLPALAFDHRKLLDKALSHLRSRLGETPIAFELLPDEFALSELQAVCEAILGRELDRRNFRRKVQESGFVTPVKGVRTGPHRPAQLFRFAPRAFERYAADRGALPF